MSEEYKGQHVETNIENLESYVREDLTGHKWKQKGPYLVCESCPVKHATWIGVDNQLVGFTEEGEPIVKPLEVED
jgi:hypothetical protein